MKRWLAFFCLPALIAATGPTPLITGAVRDQSGEPIIGAGVTANGIRTQTDSAGTFALETRSARVLITCDYCRTTEAIVDSQGTVAAVIQRYQAVASEKISAGDLRSLPYEHVESALSLEPFVVLNDSSTALPGPRLSFYGLSRFGGLLVDNGVPSYDVVADVSPWRSIPGFDAASATTSDQSQAFRYGDMASGGSYFVQTQPAGQAQGSLLNGTERAIGFAGTGSSFSGNAAASADDDDSRARADASYQFALGPGTLSAEAIASNDAQGPDQNTDSDTSAVRLHFDSQRGAHSYADLIADRSGYTSFFSPGQPVYGEWSDFSLETGVASNAPISTFVDAGARFSTGYYDPIALGGARVAGTTLQTHVSVGAQSKIGRLSWQAGLGAFNASYTGGSSGQSTPLPAQILAPSATLSYDLTPQWQLALDANQSFRLPTLVEAYGYGADLSALFYDRYGMQDAKLTFTDLRRLRVSVFAMNAHVSDLDNGNVTAAGASLAWQIAPALSVRAWTLHVDDTSTPYAPIFRFGVPPQPATPASVWMTYENSSGVRADLIWRSDLIDYRPDTHLDGSISAPLEHGFRWFIGSESRQGDRYITAGLRLAK